MVRYRFIIPSYHGKRIEGPWMRDVPFYIMQAAQVWISREVTFTIEFDSE
jgi:hypothetical protein